MKRFKEGEHVVCVRSNEVCRCHDHPKPNDIVVISHYENGNDNYVCIEGYDHSWYIESSFEKLVSDEEIEKLVNENTLIN